MKEVVHFFPYLRPIMIITLKESLSSKSLLFISDANTSIFLLPALLSLSSLAKSKTWLWSSTLSKPWWSAKFLEPFFSLFHLSLVVMFLSKPDQCIMCLFGKNSTMNPSSKSCPVSTPRHVSYHQLMCLQGCGDLLHVTATLKMQKSHKTTQVLFLTEGSRRMFKSIIFRPAS